MKKQRNYQAEITAWNNKFVQGDCSAEDYQIAVWELIESYVKYLLSKQGFLIKFPQHYEDFISEAKVVCFSQIMKYDPSENAMTTYFKKYIIQAFRQAMPKQFSATNYYDSINIIISKIAKELGYEDIQAAPTDELYKATPREKKISYLTIKRTQDYKSSSVCSLDAMTDNNDDIENLFSNPEDKVLNDEKMKIVAQLYEQLNEFEKFCVSFAYLEPYENEEGNIVYMSKRQINIAFNETDIKKRQNLHPALRDIDPQYLVDTYHNGKKVNANDVAAAVNSIVSFRSNPLLTTYIKNSSDVIVSDKSLDYGDVGTEDVGEIAAS